MRINPVIFAFVAVSTVPLSLAQTVDQFFVVYEMIRQRAQASRAVARTLVRMGFHDAMGGVDANLNFDNEDHRGLENTADMLDGLWNANRATSLAGLSKADFYAWAYIAGFYFTCEDDNVPWVPLRAGRTTYTDTNRQEALPPNSGVGSGDHQAVLDYFATNFFFDQRETAIALGAHTLGGANFQNSGYRGDWTRSENTFNSDYYEALVDPPGQGGWEQLRLNNGKFQWQWGCLNRCRDLSKYFDHIITCLYIILVACD